MTTSARTKSRLALAAGGSGGGGGGGGGGGRVMTPALLEAIRLLQMSRRELIEEIRREMAERPIHDDPKE